MPRVLASRGVAGGLRRGVFWLVGLGVSVSVMAQDSAITGTATYRERIAMPPNAVFEATLEDVSLADAPAEIMGRVQIDSPGNPPIQFEIPYDAARIESNRSYSVRGRVTVDDRLMFITDQMYPVLTRGADTDVSLVMRKTQGAELAPGAGPLGALPASFSGDLPCADCPGIRYQLDLFPDRVFFMRMHYQERDGDFDDIGRWAPSSDGSRLILQGGREAPSLFRIENVDALVKLDQSGMDIESEANHTLIRTPEFDPIEPQLMMAGMYQYMADAALFVECLTGRRLPVAQEGDSMALETAYLSAGQEPGKPLMVNLEGRIAPRSKMDGEGVEPTLVVSRFIAVQTGQSCPALFEPAALQGTEWRMVLLGDEAVMVTDEKRRPSLIFHPEPQRISGSGGCNRFTGGYEINASALTLSEVAGTLMACPDGMDLEQAVYEAFGKVRSWRVTGRQLELFDGDGHVLARFQAAQSG